MFCFHRYSLCHITICWSKVYHFTTFLGATWSTSPHSWVVPCLLLVSRFLKTPNFLHGLVTRSYLVRWQRCALYAEENINELLFCDFHFKSWLCYTSSSYSLGFSFWLGCPRWWLSMGRTQDLQGKDIQAWRTSWSVITTFKMLKKLRSK